MTSQNDTVKHKSITSSTYSGHSGSVAIATEQPVKSKTQEQIESSVEVGQEKEGAE